MNNGFTCTIDECGCLRAYNKDESTILHNATINFNNPTFFVNINQYDICVRYEQPKLYLNETKVFFYYEVATVCNNATMFCPSLYVLCLLHKPKR